MCHKHYNVRSNSLTLSKLIAISSNATDGASANDGNIDILIKYQHYVPFHQVYYNCRDDHFKTIIIISTNILAVTKITIINCNIFKILSSLAVFFLDATKPSSNTL